MTMTSSHQANSVLIVGGGSAGWMTALYLNKYFNHQRQNLKITVLESDQIGPIGVGEATVHSLRFFFAAMGLDEAELMRETNATLKTGIMFRNWMKPVDEKTHEYFHPFEQQRPAGYLDISSEWILGRQQQQRYDQATCASSALIEQQHCPKTPYSKPYQGAVPYGYHIDATLLGQFLRKKAKEAGVLHLLETVQKVNLQEQNIVSVETEKTIHCADFFIDCSGFRGMLIEALDKDNWRSFEDVLPCNKAVAIQREFAAEESPKPYTTATALSNGWAWQIDLVNRQGSGYVYDGNKITAQQAEQELRTLLGEQANTLKTLHLNMKVGCRKAFWLGNCLSIGLSAGFIEPLESTGLHLINMGVRLFATHFSSAQNNQSIRESYNKQMTGLYEDLKQFIVLHYCLTNRDDSAFWQQAQKSVELCSGLEEKIALWKHKVCEFMDLAGGYATTFTDENYRYILYGMQHYPQLSMNIDPQHNEQLFNNLRKQNEALVQQTLSHQEFLRRLHNPTTMGGNVTIKR